MSKHDVADARKNLSALMSRALEGEAVIITRRGRPVAKLTPISRPSKPVPPGVLVSVKRGRVGKRMPRENAVAAVRRLREEWDYARREVSIDEVAARVRRLRLTRRDEAARLIRKDRDR